MRMQRTRKGLGQRSRLCTGKFYLFIRRIIFYADEPSAGLLFMRKTVFESGAYRWIGMTWRGTAKSFGIFYFSINFLLKGLSRQIRFA
jgi:hypothetical protein